MELRAVTTPISGGLTRIHSYEPNHILPGGFEFAQSEPGVSFLIDVDHKKNTCHQEEKSAGQTGRILENGDKDGYNNGCCGKQKGKCMKHISQNQNGIVPFGPVEIILFPSSFGPFMPWPACCIRSRSLRNTSLATLSS